MSAPSTPNQPVLQGTPSSQPTGNWRHPRFDEINRRLEASTFNERKVKQILWRLSAVLALFLYQRLNDLLRWVLRVDLIRFTQSHLPYSVRFLLYPILPIALVIYALSPLRLLLEKPDDLSDIPLTPQQRKLLGLKPSSQPATPGSQYITPPRYSRSATPRSASSSRSGSPFSGNGSPLDSPGATYPPTPSPLFQKAVRREKSRRLSFGPPSPLTLNKQAGDSSSSLASNVSNSPLINKGASVGLNNKWLYERGRRSSSGLSRVYS